MLVEDDPAHAELAQRAFESCRDGFRLVVVGNIKDALKHLSETTPDLVISDLMLPDGRGTELITSGDNGKAYPLMVMTSQGNEQAAVEAIKAGAIDYVTKSPEVFATMPQAAERVLREWDNITARKEAKAAMEASEEKYRSLFETMHEGFVYHEIVLDSSGAPVDFIYLDINNAFTEITGLKKEDVLGKKASEVAAIHGGADEVPPLVERYASVALGGRPITFEEYSVPLERWFSIHAYSPQPSYVVILFFDITERKKAEEQLRESEEKFSKAFRSSPDTIAITRLKDGKILEISEGVGQVFGIPREEFIGRTTLELGLWANPADRADVMNRLESDGRLHNVEYQYRRKSGEVFSGLSSGEIIDIDGEKCILYIMRDITERKKAEMELATQERIFRLFIEHSPAPIAMFDRDMRYLAASRSYSAAYGVESKILVGRPHYEIFPEISEDIKAVHRRALAGATERCDEEPFYREDGRVDWVRWEVRPWEDSSGHIGGIILFSEVITERKQAEKAVRESESRYRQLFENTASGVAIYEAVDGGRDFILRGFNSAAERIDNISAGEVLGKKLTESFPGVREFGLLDVLERVWRTGDAESVPSIFYENGRVSGWREGYVYKLPEGSIVGIYTDITKRKQAEEQIRYQAQILQNTSVAIISLDNDFRIISWNPAAEKLYGWKGNEAAGKILNELVPTKYIEGTWEEHLAEFQKKGFWGGESIQRNRNGDKVYIHSSVAMMRDEAGNSIGIVVSNQNVTERRQAEEEVLKRNRELLALNEAAGIMSQSHNQPQTLEDVLELVLRVTGMEDGGIALVTEDGKLRVEAFSSRPEAIGHQDIEWDLSKGLVGLVSQSEGGIYIKNISTDPRASSRVELATSLGIKSFCGASIRAKDRLFGVICLSSNTREVPLSCDIRLLEIIANQLAMSIENTELIRQSAEMEALRELDSMRSELLSTVSHELRTPLAAIKGYASMIAEYGKQLDEEEKDQYIEAINRSSDRLTNLIDQLLDMSRLESGMLKIEFQPTGISNLLKSVVDEARMRKPTHDIELEVDGDLPEINIDPTRVRQVVDNLIDNAAKYSPSGTRITLSAYCRDDSNLEITVVDEGIGIAPDDLPKIFGRMYRGRHMVEGMSVRGVGLGLSICKGLVEAHGGQIWIESEVDKGTTCRFTLPLFDPNQTTNMAIPG